MKTTEIVLGKSLTVNYNLIMTMIDGKIINVLTNTSIQKCFICNCNPTAMNDHDKLCNFDVNIENLIYGLSTLHAWIKFLECILHISYKLSTPITKRLLEEQKILVANRKKDIQNRLWNEMGLKIDRVV